MSLANSRYHKRGRKRSLHMEALEERRLLATVNTLHDFRTDDFTFTGPLQYHFDLSQDGGGFREKMDGGTFEATSGRVVWTSPVDGSGALRGVGTGIIMNEFFSGSSTFPCSTFSIRDEGTLNFTLNAETLLGQVSNLTSESVTFPSFESHLDDPACTSPEQITRIFLGDPAQYTLGYDVTDFTLEVSFFLQFSGATVSVLAGPTIVDWTTNGNTDLGISQVQTPFDFSLPSGWLPVTQDSPIVQEPFFDPLDDLVLQLDVAGPPIPTPAGAANPVAHVALQWASDASENATTIDIPLTNPADANLFWNSDRALFTFSDFPAVPEGMHFLKATIEHDVTIADSNSANDVLFLPIATAFPDGTHTPISEDDRLDNVSSVLLDEAGAPHLRVVGYNPTSSAGAFFAVTNDDGTFRYDPTSVAAIQDLNDGEQLVDSVDFLVVQYGGTANVASLGIPVNGVTDAPQLSPISDGNIEANTTFVDVFSVTASVPANELTFSAVSNNPTLFPSSNIVITPDGTDHQVAATPADDETGYAEITITATDPNGLADSTTFQVVVGVDDFDGDRVLDEVEALAPAGDGNHDSIPDQFQAYVASFSNSSGGMTTIEAFPFHLIRNLEPITQLPPNPPQGVAFPLGGFQFDLRDLISDTGINNSIFFDDNSPSANSFWSFGPTADNDTPHWYPLRTNGNAGVTLFHDRASLVIEDNGAGDDDSRSGRSTSVVFPGVTDTPWTNPVLRSDVNNDHVVTPLDALEVIEALNRGNLGELPMFPTQEIPITSFFDTSGNHLLSAQDVLIVITDLVSGVGGESSDERTALPLDLADYRDALLVQPPHTAAQQADTAFAVPVAMRSVQTEPPSWQTGWAASALRFSAPDRDAIILADLEDLLDAIGEDISAARPA